MQSRLGAMLLISLKNLTKCEEDRNGADQANCLQFMVLGHLVYFSSLSIDIK